MSKGFDIQRLYGGQLCSVFDGDDGDIVIYSHYPEKMEHAISLTDAGLAPDEEGNLDISDKSKVLCASVQAKVNLALLCIDRVEGFDPFPVDGTEVHEPYAGGMRRLKKEYASLFPEIVLYRIGVELEESAQVSEGED